MAPPLIFCAPFTLAVIIRGYTTFITDIKRDPGFARRLLEYLCQRVIVPWVKFQHYHCPEATLAQGVDAWGSLPNTDLQIWDEFILPTCGLLREMLAGEIGVGLVGYWGESLSPDAREFAKRKLDVAGPCFEGSIMANDPDLERLGPQIFVEMARDFSRGLILGIGAESLRQGSPEAIAARIQQYTDILQEQVPVKIFLAHITCDTPPEHIHAAVRAAHQGTD